MLLEESHIDLIPQSEYFFYLDKLYKNKEITLCQTKKFKKCYHNKEFNYPTSNSNKMISTYLQYMKKDKNMFLYIKLYTLFTYFMSSKMAIKMIDKIKHQYILSDRDFIQSIFTLNKKNKDFFNKNICNDNENLYSLLYHYYQKIRDLKTNKSSSKKNNSNKMIQYLDIGCGNGNKTMLISKIFHISKNNVFCTDIPSWDPYEKERISKFEINHFQPIDPSIGKLNFEDNKFDLISVILTLHHIPNLSQTLREIKRILKPNGVLLVIEHNVLKKYDHLLIEIQHMLYGYTYDKKNPDWKNYINNPITNRYMNLIEWTFLFDKNNFQYLYGDTIYDQNTNQPRFDNQFYGFWRNKK